MFFLKTNHLTDANCGSTGRNDLELNSQCVGK
jgi:hypothetical protein